MEMRRFLLLTVLICLLAFTLAVPGKASKRKEKQREEREKAKGDHLKNYRYINKYKEVSTAEYWKGREDEAADRATVPGAVAYLDLKTLQQTYFFIIFEYKGDVVRRRSACRSATGQKGTKMHYVSYDNLNIIY